MTIGIIGAGIAGLTAGRILAKAGHDVLVFEKSRGFGGRMATRYLQEDLSVKADHGATHFTASSEEFKTLVKELEDKGIVQEWTNHLGFHDGEQLLDHHPNREAVAHYMAPQGMNAIGKQLARWSDVTREERVAGITLIGENPVKKKQWMINLQSFNTFEVDAIIIATPGVQAFGLIQTAQDERAVRVIIRDLDEVTYSPSFSVIMGFPIEQKPEWKAFTCNNPHIQLVSNESSKRDTGKETVLVVQTSAEFTRKHLDSDYSEIAELVANQLGTMLGSWAQRPAWANVHLWKYHQPEKKLPGNFMELEGHPAPLALIGDYFETPGVEGAFLSGYRLAHHWLQRFKAKR